MVLDGVLMRWRKSQLAFVAAPVHSSQTSVQWWTSGAVKPWVPLGPCWLQSAFQLAPVTQLQPKYFRQNPCSSRRCVHSSHSSAVALSLPPRSRRLPRLSRTGWHDPACRRFGYRDAKAQFAPASGDGAAGRLVGFGVGVSPLFRYPMQAGAPEAVTPCSQVSGYQRLVLRLELSCAVVGDCTHACLPGTT